MNKKKLSDFDDNHTIADMNVQGMPFYYAGTKFTKKEIRAILKALLQILLPIAAYFALGYTLFLVAFSLLSKR
ncbi:MAG: hypothetical protein ACRC5H_00590 [Treponemataceae bacterium]